MRAGKSPPVPVSSLKKEEKKNNKEEKKEETKKNTEKSQLKNKSPNREQPQREHQEGEQKQQQLSNDSEPDYEDFLENFDSEDYESLRMSEAGETESSRDEGFVKTDYNVALDNDHRQEDRSESSEPHPRVEENDSSEDEAQD